MNGLMSIHYYEMSIKIHTTVFQVDTELPPSTLCQPLYLPPTLPSLLLSLIQLPALLAFLTAQLCQAFYPEYSYLRFACLAPFLQISPKCHLLREVISDG